MAKAKPTANVLGLVESDSEDDLGGVRIAAKRTAVEMAGAKRGRAPENKVTKPAQKATRRTNAKVAAAIEEEGARQALVDKSNAQPTTTAKRGRKGAAVKEVIEVIEVIEASAASSDNDAPKVQRPRGRPKGSKAAQPDPVKEIPDSAGPEQLPVAAKRRGRKPAAVKPAEVVHDETEIPETQEQDPMDVDEAEDVQLESPPAVRRMEPASVRRHLASPVRRPVAVPDPDQNDIALRRRLGDLTRKYENMESKYHDLKEIGIKEAERNFDRLKKLGEEKTKSSDELVATLKAELAAQKELVKEGIHFKKQWEMVEAKVDSLQTKITDMTTSLSEARTENKALSAKLAASRAAEAAATKVPGSAMKAGKGASRIEAMQASSQTAHMKEDLYGDLTGLIVRGVKRESGEQDIYDCIQTGRNGTLHFKLSMSYDATSESYDEAQFIYMPQLDSNRDRALIDILPDYLVDEITFPRPHAAKFYSRMMKALTERV